LAQYVAGPVEGIATPQWKSTDRYVPEEDPLQKMPERRGDAAVFYYHCDQIGTPQLLTDDDGDVVWEASYKAWGEAREAIARASKATGIVAKNALRFQGQWGDDETGLHYNRYRYYDPGSGRFVSKDPIGLAGGINVYQYAENPVHWTDPLGLASKLACPICCDGSHGRSNKQERLKALADDPLQPRWVRGWVRNEMRHIDTGNRTLVRLPGNSRNSRTPGMELAHGRGTEAKDGYCYRHSELQDAVLHKTQHQVGGY
ncbi:sugar-binding protein, partial [Burkholderia ubonensis]